MPLEDLARFLGVKWKHLPLPPELLAERVSTMLSAVRRFAAQVPEDSLFVQVPMLRARKRSYADIASHIGLLVECFPELLENGRRLELKHTQANTPEHVKTRQDLLNFLACVHQRFDGWWTKEGRTTDYVAKADVYYGNQTIHEYFERTAWHAAQHARQLQAALEDIGIAPNSPLKPADLEGLPLPKDVIDG